MTRFLFLVLTLLIMVACGNMAEEPSPSGALFVTSVPSEAEVLINGQLRGRTPLTVRDLTPRDYDIILRKENYQAVGMVVTIRPRQTANIAHTLQLDLRPTDHRLAFISNRDGAYDIWLKDQRSAQGIRWTALRWPNPPSAASLSPDGNYFAVSVSPTKDTQTSSLATWIIRAPRFNMPEVQPEPWMVRGDLLQIIQWAPDSRTFLLKNLVSQTVWLGNLSGNLNQVVVPDAPRGVTAATFTPDGAAMAYSAEDKTWQINLDGTRRQELGLNGSAGNAFLRYAPDGQKLLHVRVQKPNVYRAGELWIMNANGSSPSRMSLIGAQDFDPIWTRDGKQIVFVHRDNVEDERADQDTSRLVSNLWVIDLTTRTSRTLTAFQGKRVWEPSLSPDDQLVTFVTNTTGQDELWSVDLRGGDPQQITHDKQVTRFPLWLW